jgi:hypothetical protein
MRGGESASVTSTAGTVSFGDNVVLVASVEQALKDRTIGSRKIVVIICVMRLRARLNEISGPPS